MAGGQGVEDVRREGTVLDASVLKVGQDELRGSYRIDDRDGKRVAEAVPAGESPLTWILRLVGLGAVISRRIEVRDADGRPWLELVRPRALFSSNFVVSRPDGSEVARIEHKRGAGKKVFTLLAGEQPVGEFTGDWSASTFTVADTNGRVVASAARGVGSALGLLPDNYTVEVTEKLKDPLASLVLVAALCADLAFHEK